MFTTRLINSIIPVLPSIIIAGQGETLLYATTVLISIIGLFGFYRALGIQRRSLAVVGYVTACSYYGFLWFKGQHHMTLMIITCLMAMVALYVFTFPEYKTKEVAGAFFGACYVPIILSFPHQTGDMSDNAYLVRLISLNSWGYNTFAYCIDILLGKYGLAPVPSPRKSAKGTVGGVVDAAPLGFIYASLFGTSATELDNPQAACIITRAITMVVSQTGDLAASATKRDHDIKDYGHLTPDHGGILDWFDSMIFTTPAIYFTLTFSK